MTLNCTPQRAEGTPSLIPMDARRQTLIYRMVLERSSRGQQAEGQMAEFAAILRLCADYEREPPEP
jgi:hypothetical protein